MKTKILIAVVSAFMSQAAQANYKITITNGGAMPISPGVIYATADSKGLAEIGDTPTMGFVQLCQTGNANARAMELQKNTQVMLVQNVPGPILPGQRVDVIVSADPTKVSLHFEAMYGKTKDACAIATIHGNALQGIGLNSTDSLTLHDQVVATGAFQDPVIPQNPTNQMTCYNAMSAVDCLRSLAGMSMGGAKIRAFPGYLPRVIDFIEQKYGAMEAQSLLVPTSGTVLIRVGHQ